MSALSNLFGPSRAEIWRKLSEEIGATYVDGGFWSGDRVEATHGHWTVTLDKFVVTTGKTTIPFTRMRAPFVNSGGFRFCIYNTNLFSGIARWLGVQDIQIGYEPFDSEFVIQGNDEPRVKALLSHEPLRALITSQHRVSLEVRDDEGWFGPKFPEGVDELRFAVPGIMKDLGQLKDLYQLFAETLDSLCRIGVAEDGDPGVRL